MPLNYVTVNFTFDNISGAAAQGFVSIAPTGVVTNAAGQAVVSSAPVTATLGGSGTASISIVAMDNSGLTPAAGYWAYNFTVNLNGQSAYTQTLIVNFANGATQAFTALPVAVPATAYSAVSTSGGFVSPMTTLGDLIYENATPAAARLAGDTSNTRKFLRTQASAGVAQAPAWDTLVAGDLPNGITLAGYLAPAVAALTFGATIAVNAALANDFRLTLTASTGTISNPTNPVDGQIIEFAIAQDATGSRTVAWGTAYDFGTAGAPTLSTTASKVDLVGFKYHAGLAKWLCMGSALGF